MRIFLDVNIAMYAAGAPHPYRDPCRRLAERVARGDLDAVTDAEALQEILYRYWHLRIPEKGRALLESWTRVVPEVLPVTKGDAILAGVLMSEHPALEPRDAVHAAVMLNNGLTHLYSYDKGFDRVSGLKRLKPE
jgi:predicted nucleic acid-binding protein